MLNTALSAPQFVAKRKRQIESISNILKNRVSKHNDNEKQLKKRTIGKLYYRTKSFKSYKIPRKRRRTVVKVSKITNDNLLKRCRKHRRHIMRKLADYNTSKTTGIRLQTHVWHTKRMIMKPLYGYMVATRSSFRSFKAIDTLYERKTLVHDNSYEKAISFQCTREDLLAILSSIIDPASSIIDAVQSKWKPEYCREFKASIHSLQTFPLGLIGPVTITVKRIISPSNQTHEVLYQVWIWCHPVVLAPIQTLLVEAAKIITANAVNDESSPADAAASGIIFQVRHDLCRLDLYGTHKMETLGTCLLPFLVAPSSSSSSAVNNNDVLLSDSIDTNNSFFQALFQDQARKCNTLHNVWRDGEGLSLYLRDPRLPNTSNNTTNNIMSNASTAKATFAWPKYPSYSPLLWSDCSSLQVSNNSVLNQGKHYHRLTQWQEITSALASSTTSTLPPSSALGNQVLFPLTTTTITNTPSLTSSSSSTAVVHPVNTFPILLINHADSSTNASTMAQSKALYEFTLPSMSCILPATATKLFWQEILLKKGKVVSIGLEEKDYLQQQHGILSYPQDYLDCEAGLRYWQTNESNDDLTKMQLCPPHMRQADRVLFRILRNLQKLVMQKKKEKENSVDNDDMNNEATDDEDEDGMEISFTIDNQGASLQPTHEIEQDQAPELKKEEDVQQITEQKAIEEKKGIEEELIVDLTVLSSSFVVMRNLRHIHSLVPLAAASSEGDATTMPWYETMLQNPDPTSFALPPRLPPLPNLTFPTYIQLFLRKLTRGIIHSQALLYLPTMQDLTAYLHSLALNKQYLNSRKLQHKEHQQNKKKKVLPSLVMEADELPMLLSKKSKKNKKNSQHSMQIENAEDDGDDGLGYIAVKGHFVSQMKPNQQSITEQKGTHSTTKTEEKSNDLLDSLLIEHSKSQHTFWKGVHVGPNALPASETRQVVGIVSSGFPHHVNDRHAYLSRTTACAIGCADLPMLYEHIRTYHLYHEYSNSGLIILFRNPSSPWLRPAVLSFAPM